MGWNLTKSCKFHLLVGDFRESSHLIGWEQWSHDFAVRFGQNGNDVIPAHGNDGNDRERHGNNHLIEEIKSFPNISRIENRTIIKEVTGIQSLVIFDF